MDRNGGILDLGRATSSDGMKACKIPARAQMVPSLAALYLGCK